jgi:hypothetical protein
VSVSAWAKPCIDASGAPFEAASVDVRQRQQTRVYVRAQSFPRVQPESTDQPSRSSLAYVPDTGITTA